MYQLKIGKASPAGCTSGKAAQSRFRATLSGFASDIVWYHLCQQQNYLRLLLIARYLESFYGFYPRDPPRRNVARK